MFSQHPHMCLALSDGKVNMSHVHLKGNAKNEAKSLMSSIVTTCTLLSFFVMKCISQGEKN